MQVGIGNNLHALATVMVRFVMMVALFCGAAVPAEGAGPPRTNRRSSAGEFFSEPVLRVFRIEVPDAATNQLRQSPRAYVTGKIMEGDHVLTNVAIRLRGHGSFRSLDERPSFAVKFDEFATNQTYRGLTKLMFNNSVQDSTRFADFVSTQLFREAGVPAARVTHAQVQFNGRDLGVYVVIEAMNKKFLKQHFKSAQGNLYEAHLTDIDVPMEQDNGTRSNQLDRVKLYQVCALTNAAERWGELHKVLDVDRFVSFAAMEMLTAHWDGYVMHTNNYRMYRDPRSDKFVFIPHGMDWTFLRPTLSIESPRKSVVGHAVLSTAEGQRLYRERFGTLFTNVLRAPVILDRIDREMKKIRTANLNSNELAIVESGAVLMRDRVSARIKHAAHEMAGKLPTPLPFDTNGLAALTHWRADRDGATGTLDRVTIDGKPALHIRAGGPHAHASWRSLVYLPRGLYRFEGKLRIAATGIFVATLRTSGPSTSTSYQNSTDWRELSYDFRITDQGIDTEFVCDFSGVEGDAWFDLNSLRVRRIEP